MIRYICPDTQTETDLFDGQLNYIKQESDELKAAPVNDFDIIDWTLKKSSDFNQTGSTVQQVSPLSSATVTSSLQQLIQNAAPATPVQQPQQQVTSLLQQHLQQASPAQPLPQPQLQIRTATTNLSPQGIQTLQPQKIIVQHVQPMETSTLQPQQITIAAAPQVPAPITIATTTQPVTPAVQTLGQLNVQQLQQVRYIDTEMNIFWVSPDYRAY